MKGFLTLVVSLIIGLSFGQAQPKIKANKVDPYLLRLIKDSPESYHKVYILLKDRVDILNLERNLNKTETSLEMRAYQVITSLQTKAASTQEPIISKIQNDPAVKSTTIHPLWITNAIFVEMKPEAIARFSNNRNIDWIGWNTPVELEAYKDEPNVFSVKDLLSVGGIEPGLSAINAPSMWKLGYTGYGRSALSVDTGVEPTHPALSHQYRGLYVPSVEAWYDYRNATPSPYACGSTSPSDHGTHTVGTMVGLDPVTKDTVGVAFGGMWMASPAICDSRSEDNLASFQWALNPDRDPNTINDMPDVINNSWRTIDVANECSDQLYIEALTALEAAGVAVVFSAGNKGPSSSSITSPKNINIDEVNSFAVGAINGKIPSYAIANFSSRGPSTCGGSGSLEIKPEVSAPGLAVRSTELDSSYGSKSGTSMAAPHVSGAVLLLKEAFPYLTGKEVKLALYHSAVDLGAAGEDNKYGMGLIDVMAAYNYLVNDGHTPVIPNKKDDAAITSIFNLPKIICDSFVSPKIILENKGTENLQSALISYTFNNGTFGGINWSGNLAQDSAVTISLPIFPLIAGTYQLEVEVSNPNGVQDYRYLDNKKEALFIIPGAPPIVENDTICSGANGLLSAFYQSQNADIWWYEDSLTQTPLFVGNPLITPALDSNKTFYAGIAWAGKTGENNRYSNGTGDYSAHIGEYLTFDALAPFMLKSVLVFSQTDGYRTVELRDVNGNVIATKIVFLNIGEARIDLSFMVDPGKDYVLMLNTAANLYSHSSGAQYPYQIPGVISINGSSKGLGPYFYFYDWEIQYENICGRSRVEVVLDTGLMQTEFFPDITQLTLPDTATVHFTDLSTNAQSWFWDFGDGQTSTLQNPSHTYSTAGTYVVGLSATGPDGCSDAYGDTIYVAPKMINTGIDNRLQSEIEVYPNPSAGVFTIVFDQAERLSSQIEVFDLRGKKLILPIKKAFHHDQIQLDLSNFPDGIYYLHISTTKSSFTKKLMKKN